MRELYPSISFTCMRSVYGKGNRQGHRGMNHRYALVVQNVDSEEKRGADLCFSVLLYPRPELLCPRMQLMCTFL
jgi:hypothetical protein